MNSTVSPYHHHYNHHPYTGYRFENTTRFYTQSSPTEEIFDDEDQIPTVEEFRAIIEDYLNNLSPKKRDKALVDQHRYLLIQQVLRDPRNTAISTAQFRFWVKKMFQLQPGTTDLVCHDNKPVAMKEQIYDILVKAHREAHHGGRDKTSALVRRRFSWIPKELVARFVRHCPFCITRRNSGHSPSSMMSKSSSSPRSRYSRHACSFDSNATSLSIKEESDLSSGPPSSDSGYEATPNYITMSSSSTPSPRRHYFSSMYDKEDSDFLDCPYDTTIQNSFAINGFRNDHSPSSGTNTTTTNTTTIHPLTHHQHHHHPQPHSPLFYHHNYTGYPFYNTGYYPNALGITPCQENNNTSTTPSSTSSSSAAAVAVAAASSTAAAAAAAAAALMRSPVGTGSHRGSDLLSHHHQQDSHYNMNPTCSSTSSSAVTSSSNNTHSSSRHFVSYQPLNIPDNAFKSEL